MGQPNTSCLPLFKVQPSTISPKSLVHSLYHLPILSSDFKLHLLTLCRLLKMKTLPLFLPPEDSHVGFLPPTPCSLRIQPRGNQLHAWGLPSVFRRLYWFPFSPGPASTSTDLGNSASCLHPRGYRSQSPFPLSESPSSSLPQQFFAAFEGMVSIFYPGFFFPVVLYRIKLCYQLLLAVSRCNHFKLTVLQI